MEDDTTITPLHQPGSVLDPLSEIAREGARQMLAAALKAEATAFVRDFRTIFCPTVGIASCVMAAAPNA